MVSNASPHLCSTTQWKHWIPSTLATMRFLALNHFMILEKILRTYLTSFLYTYQLTSLLAQFSVFSHAAIQNQLISGRSCYAEEQERDFNTVTNIMRSTSSNHPNHITGNVFLHLGKEKWLSDFQTPVTDTQEAHLNKLASALPNFQKTIVPQELLV